MRATVPLILFGDRARRKRSPRAEERASQPGEDPIGVQRGDVG